MDMAEREGKASEVVDLSHFETLLAELSSRFVHIPAAKIDGEINDSLRRVCEFFDLEMATLWRQSAAYPGSIILTHFYGPVAAPSTLENLKGQELFPWCFGQVTNGDVVAVSTLEELPEEAARDRESWRQFGVKSNLTIGLAFGEESIVGALSFNSMQTECQWPELLVTRLLMVAQIFSNALARQSADSALHESEERFRSLFENATVGIYRTTPSGRILAANPTLIRMLGYRDFESLATRNLEEQGFEPSYQRKAFCGRMEQESKVIGLESTWNRQDGSSIFVRESAQAIRGSDGNILYYDGIIEDITERKHAEDALRLSEAKYRTVVEMTGTGFHILDLQGRVLEANEEYVRLSGHSALSEILGRSVIEWTAEEAKKRNADAIARCAKNGFIRNFVTQYVDREGRTSFIEINATVEGEGDGRRVISLSRDVTERMRYEQAIQNLSARLISAQEEERTRIARELHDDINQRMGLLATELAIWSQYVPESAVDLLDRIRDAKQRLLEMSMDIQALSHRLHSSKLEYLGLVSAANSFCMELAEKQGVHVEFVHSDVPQRVPSNISLCLFRVLQQALQNAAKHSGSPHVKVELRGRPGEIQLIVSDSGIGFDPKEAIDRTGIGLISMKERLGLVNGQCSITSAPGKGTTIYASVPFGSN